MDRPILLFIYFLLFIGCSAQEDQFVDPEVAYINLALHHATSTHHLQNNHLSHNTCIYYVCNIDDCTDLIGKGDIPIFSTIQSAINNASFSCPNDSPSYIYIYSSIYEEVVHIKDTLNHLTITSIGPHKAILRGRLSITNWSPMQLLLHNLVIEPSHSTDKDACLLLVGEHRSNILVDGCKMTCDALLNFTKVSFQTSAKASSSGRIQVSSSEYLGPYNVFLLSNGSYFESIDSELRETEISVGVDSSILLADSLTTGGLRITSFDPKYSSLSVQLFNCTLEGYFDVFAENAVINVSISDSEAKSYVTLFSHQEVKLQLSRSIFNNTVTTYSEIMTNVGAFENHFVADSQLDEIPMFVITSAANLILSGRCHAHFNLSKNTFVNGTLYFVSNTNHETCDDRPFLSARKAILRENVFPKSNLKLKYYDLYEDKVVPAISYFNRKKSTVYGHGGMSSETIVDASYNYWGSHLGPSICCNPDGDGSFTSSFVNTSYWCTDPSCNNQSNTQISEYCIKSGCKQVLSTIEKTGFFGFFALAILIVLFSITIMAKRISFGFTKYLLQDDNASNLKSDDSQSSLLWESQTSPSPDDQTVVTLDSWRIACIFSSVASMLTIGCVAIMLNNTTRTPIRPHQQRLPLRGWIIMILFCSIECTQIILGFVTFKIKLIRSRYSTLFRAIVKGILFFNISIICIVFTVCLYWVPTASSAQFIGPFYLSNPTSLLWLLYLPALLIISTAVSILMPIRKLNKLIFHFEYSKISSTLETELFHTLRHSPEIKRSAKRLRIVMCLLLVIAIGLFALTLRNFFSDPILRSTYLRRMPQFVIAIILIILAIVLTFMEYRTTLFMSILVGLAIIELAALQDLIFWINYFTHGSVTTPTILQISNTIAWIILMAVAATLIYQFRAMIMEMLPKIITTHLDEHLDTKWNLNDSWNDSWNARQDKLVHLTEQPEDELVSHHEH